MKLTINKNDIINVLSNIQGITGRKSNLAITETVLIQATGSEIKFIATDLETGFVGSYPASIDSEGSIAINSRKFYEIVKDFPGNEILIDEVENHWIKISNKNVNYQIVGMNPDDFPDVPILDNVDFFNIKASILRRMIEKTVIITGVTDDKRAHINGIYFERIKDDDQQQIRMVSTDGSRLMLVDHIYDKNFNLPPVPGIIIPKKGLNEVNKFLNYEGSVQIGSKDNNFIIKKDTETIIIRLLEGNFPQYDDIIKKEGGQDIVLEKNIFLMMLKRMSILSSENYKGAIFNFNENKLKVSVTNPDIGESKEDLDIGFTGKPIEVSFNPRYFIEILNIIDDDKIVLYITNEEKPCFVEGEKDKTFLSVIMPMRI
ncbi:MAG: DNA polymerase III subunit beta [Thermodesulfobacteriota bacterium]|nr:DNA polymerase III subunit beta [Thermodesulfobacteriota bacterium]